MEKTHTYQVQEVDWSSKTFVVRRATLTFDKLSQFFSTAYNDLYAALTKSGIITKAPPFAIYFSVDIQKNETDLAAAVSVPESSIVPPGFEKNSIPEAKALLVTYYGPYENMTNAYGELDKYLEGHQLKKAWMLEEYFSDPVQEPDPAKWKTNIYYILG